MVCGNGNQRPSTLDLIVNDLLHRALLPEDPRLWRAADWERKVPSGSITMSLHEDVTGNGCPFGFPMCARGDRTDDPARGDICHSVTIGVGWRCPQNCHRVGGRTLCAAPDGSPCRAEQCSQSTRLPQAFGLVLSSQALAAASIGPSSTDSSWVA